MEKFILLLLGLMISFQGWSKKLEVYLDYASLPSLNMIFDLVEKKDDLEVEKVVGFERFNLGNDKLQYFPKDKLSFYPVSLQNIEPFSNKLFNTIKDSSDKVDLVIHTNLDHSLFSLLSIWKKLEPLKDKFEITKLYLYDDGSMNYKKLYENRNKDISTILQSSYQNLGEHLRTYNRDIQDLHSLSRYTWHKFFPTEYILLRPDYLSIDVKMKPLKDYLSDHVSTMNWERFNQLTQEEKNLFLKIVNFNEEIYNKLKNNNLNQKTFIFTGTTTWFEDQNERLKNAKLQTKILNKFLDKNGEFYLGDDIKVYFKGHPKGGDINEYILQETGAENIPANIPFEVLIMTDTLPDFVGGIMSSVYFSLPTKNISKVVFLSSEKIKNEQDARSEILSQLMLMLGIIKPEQIIFQNINE
ncbi:hypothetical protein [Avibacterium sp. 21-599]|uniref:hypothetical protein n=1 Tax=Avibacterium sp. 21-599 TaxID=2911528 RepID=UPI002246F92D|nr:hypothetical protein [Avibacterium sp. 21-599]MCW9718047.1 hypothetical protein [Avibacterium sp. 21-599]